jgi:hypothetical protein
MADNTVPIVIGSIASGAVGALLLSRYVFYPKAVPPAYSPGSRGIDFGQYTSLITWFKVLGYFLPYGLFLFGVIYDGLVRKIKFFPAGFTGLVAVYMNWAVSSLLGNAVPDTDACGIPGMSTTGSNIAPQAMVFNVTVMSYLASYITATNLDDTQFVGLSWVGVAAVVLVGILQYWLNDCANRIGGWKFTLFGNTTPLLLATMFGMSIGGGIGFVFSKYVTGDSAGVGITSEQKQTLTQTSGPAMAPTSDTAGAGKCSPTGDDDQFVCEAYKNGELVTSTIVE